MKIKQSIGDNIFSVIVYTLLTLIGIIIIYPLLFVVSASFSHAPDVISGRVWFLPVNPTLLAYQQVFKNPTIISGYLNTIFYAVFGTLISMVVTICAAFPLSRKNLIGHGVVTKIFLFTMLFSGGLIPFYLTVKNLGMLYTRWAVIVPVAFNFFHVVLMRTHIQTAIPEELFEAAEIDGCSNIGKLFRIVIPLSGSIMAVLILYGVVGQWNSYFNAMIFLKGYDKYPLQIVLRDILINNTANIETVVNIEALILKQGLADVMKYALIVISSLPLLLVYPFVQKYFVKGVMMGSLKG